MKIKYKVVLGAVSLFLIGCAATVIHDPIALNQKLISFNVAVQSKDYESALEMLHPLERRQIMNAEGDVKPEYLLGMRRLRLSTLKQKDLMIDSKLHLIGMLAVLKESSIGGKISKEQRSLTIKKEVVAEPIIEKKEVEIQSSSEISSSSSVLVVEMPASSMSELEAKNEFENIEAESAVASPSSSSTTREFDDIEGESEKEFEKVEETLVKEKVAIPPTDSAVKPTETVDSTDDFEGIEKEAEPVVDPIVKPTETVDSADEFEDIEKEAVEVVVSSSSEVGTIEEVEKAQVASSSTLSSSSSVNVVRENVKEADELDGFN